MKKPGIKQFVPYIIGIVLFLLITIIYFNPLLQGKALQQSDITHFRGMSEEIKDYRERTGEEPLWTNSMFGGMPAFQISVKYKANLADDIDKILRLGLPRPADYVFLYFLGFFILLLALRVNPWLSVAGAIAFAFSSYFFIILDAGHNSKAHAIAYMAPVIAGFILTMRKKYLLGGVITALFLALELEANHFQITYYLLLIIVILGISELVRKIRQKELHSFFKGAGVLIIALLIAGGTSFSNLWSTWQYGKYTIRGETELTSNKENRTSGLDKDYATAWSYGKAETLTLLIPNFRGGASVGELGENSETYQTLEERNVPRQQIRELTQQVPLYWGKQPSTSGPVYVGAIVVFLFVLGLFIVERKHRWWLLIATILSFALAWGKNFMPLTDFFLEYVPFYNKFRAVSMTLVIAELTMPLMAFLALREIFQKEYDKQKMLNYLKYTFIITGGITLLFALFSGSLFTFVGPQDARLQQGGYPEWFLDAIREDRARLLRIDAWRSFVFITLTAAMLWAYVAGKLKKQYAFVALIALLLIDMWPVNRRYLNNNDFDRERKVENPFQKTQADQQILQDDDPNFRVFNVAGNTFNDARTSYFHKSIGGYHGAKLRRYQELIDHHISKYNRDVLNMLNAKYFLVQDNNNRMAAQPNPNALGHAWFVENYRMVENADQEINALNNFSPDSTAIIDDRFSEHLQGYKRGSDPDGHIKLTHYEPNHLKYNFQAGRDQLVVFSEIYYPAGWQAYVDGEEMPHFRVNYVLRAMVVPEGQHTIEFKFRPKSYYVGEKVSLASSIILIVLILLGGFVEMRKRMKEE
ncbi:MAG: YfhO family protein [Bacteroidales bacterium]|nr:YfhO family protein [Bacteroidales bacterium]